MQNLPCRERKAEASKKTITGGFWKGKAMSETPELKLTAKHADSDRHTSRVALYVGDTYLGSIDSKTKDIAQFVRVIDSHDALLAACKGMVAVIEQIRIHGLPTSEVDAILEKSLAAIRAAEPEPTPAEADALMAGTEKAPFDDYKLVRIANAVVAGKLLSREELHAEPACADTPADRPEQGARNMSDEPDIHFPVHGMHGPEANKDLRKHIDRLEKRLADVWVAINGLQDLLDKLTCLTDTIQGENRKRIDRLEKQVQTVIHAFDIWGVDGISKRVAILEAKLENHRHVFIGVDGTGLQTMKMTEKPSFDTPVEKAGAEPGSE